MGSEDASQSQSVQVSVKAVSCDSCRSLKRRCDRAQPCSYCIRTRRDCRYDASATGPTTTISPVQDNLVTFAINGSDPKSSSGTAQAINGLGLVDIDTCLRHSEFVHGLLAIWFRELDFMYDIVAGTEVANLWNSGTLDSATYPKYAALLAGIMALTGQLCALELDSLLQSCFGPHHFSQHLVVPAIEFSECRIKEVAAKPEVFADQLPEHLQAHYILCAYEKNKGEKTQYRGKLLYGIGLFFNASYHLLDAYEGENAVNQTSSPPHSIAVLTIDQRHLVRRLFWGLFACDRLFSTVDGSSSSYMINALHVDLWLHSRGGQQRHLHDIIASYEPQQHNDVQSEVAAISPPGTTARSFVSGYIETLVNIAAASGRCLDRLATLRARRRRRLSSDSVSPQEISDQISAIDAEVGHLREVANEPLQGMCSRQAWIVRLTVLKFQRDMAIASAAILAETTTKTEDAGWLDEWQLSTAHLLLEHALGAMVDLSPRSMAWIFFLNYIAEPTGAIMKAVIDRNKSQLPSRLHADLYLVIRSRNLLCNIAVQSGSSLALQYARSLCSQLLEAVIVLLPLDNQQWLLSIPEIARSISPREFADAFTTPSPLAAQQQLYLPMDKQMDFETASLPSAMTSWSVSDQAESTSTSEWPIDLNWLSGDEGDVASAMKLLLSLPLPPTQS